MKKLLIGIGMMLPLITIILGTGAYLWTHEEAGGRELLGFFVMLGFASGVVIGSMWLFGKGLKKIVEVDVKELCELYKDHLKSVVGKMPESEENLQHSLKVIDSFQKWAEKIFATAKEMEEKERDDNRVTLSYEKIHALFNSGIDIVPLANTRKNVIGLSTELCKEWFPDWEPKKNEDEEIKEQIKKKCPGKEWTDMLSGIFGKSKEINDE